MSDATASSLNIIGDAEEFSLPLLPVPCTSLFTASIYGKGTGSIKGCQVTFRAFAKRQKSQPWTCCLTGAAFSPAQQPDHLCCWLI